MQNMQQNPFVQLYHLFQSMQGGMPNPAGQQQVTGVPGGAPGQTMPAPGPVTGVPGGRPAIENAAAPQKPGQFDINALLQQIFGPQPATTAMPQAQAQPQASNPYTYGQFGGEQLFTGVTGQPVAQVGEIGGGAPIPPPMPQPTAPVTPNQPVQHGFGPGMTAPSGGYR